MTPYQPVGNLEVFSQPADFVLKEETQGLNQAAKGNILRQAAHVVMAFDDGALSGAAFHHVGVDSPLHQIFNIRQLARFLLENPDEFFPDELALTLRVDYTGKL